MDASKQNQLSNRIINFILKKSTVWAFLTTIVYRIVLDLSYYLVISKVWAYTKFEFHLNIIKLVESYFLLFMVFASMPKSQKKLSNVVVWLLVLLSYIPMLTLFALRDESRVFVYAVTGFWALVFLLLRLPGIAILRLKQSQSKIILNFILTGLIVIVPLIIYKYMGFSFNLDLAKVYDIRTRYVEMGIPFAGYLFNWAAFIAYPVLFGLFVVKRKWISAVSVLALQTLLFSVTGMKTFLFALPFVLVLMWIVARKNPLAWMAIGLVGVILLGMGTYWLIDDIWISSLFTRRTLLLPAQASFFYHDFFSHHDCTFLSQHHIFRSFLDYPYHLYPAYLIGEAYYNNPETGANNGIYGDAYMNFGFIGLVLWAILLVVILNLIDTFSKGKKRKVVIAAVAIPVIALANGALLTTLLTHGLLLALILLYLLPERKIAKL